MYLGKTVAWLSVVAILLCSFAAAQMKLGPKDSTPMPATDLNRIKVGEEAPDFTLEKQVGQAVTLSDYRGRKSVVLVFYRGYW
jgi:cytochrome oxidase Cu insertion factor (SCO1/SenC/PrrC family)